MKRTTRKGNPRERGCMELARQAVGGEGADEDERCDRAE